MATPRNPNTPRDVSEDNVDTSPVDLNDNYAAIRQLLDLGDIRALRMTIQRDIHGASRLMQTLAVSIAVDSPVYPALQTVTDYWNASTETARKG